MRVEIPADPPGHEAPALLGALWREAGGAPGALARVELAGVRPWLPAAFAVDRVAAVSIAAAGLAAAELWRARTGRAQHVRVDGRAAQIAFRSERYLRVDGRSRATASPIWGYYRTADGGWVQLHTTFPHHEAGALALLGARPERAAVARAVAGWEGEALERALAERGLVGALMRTREEWLAHPQGQALAAAPLLELERIGDAPPEDLPRTPGAPPRPLAGVRVLDLTRVIAGPVCGRTLAEHGAGVLRIDAPHLPGIPFLDIDTGRGKRSAHLDLRRPEGRARLEALAAGADVLVQGYRPGALAGLGLGPEALAARRPGLVYVSLCAYGYAGPWAGRRGFDSLVQMASGIADAGARAAGADEPRPLPCQALDHGAGYLAAFGAMMALARRAAEGGSWHVRVSLAQVSQWLWALGPVAALDQADPGLEDVADLLEEGDSPFGRVRYVRPAARLSETPAYWALPAVPIGTHRAEWPG